MGIAAIIIAASLLASRVLGILREMLLARVAGVALEKNALDLAFLVPDILNSVVSTGFLSIIFIPIFTGYLVRSDEDGAWKFFSNILNAMAALLVLLSVPAFVWMRELILLFTASDPSPELLDRSVYFARIILPGQFFFLVGSFLVAVQHTRKQFLVPALTGVVYNASIVGGGWLFRAHGVEGFAWGVPVGAFVGFFVMQIAGVARGGARYRLGLWLRDADLRRAAALMLPMMLGSGSMFALEFVIRSFGAGFGGQGISSLNYADRRMYTLVAVFGFSVGVASYPDMARLAKEGRFDVMGDKIWKSIARMMAFLVPAVVALAALAFPAVRILFERGAFGRDATETVSLLLLWYLPVSPWLCGQAVLVRAFYAQERMWHPMLLNTGVFVLTLPFYHWLAGPMGIRSVPLVGAVGVMLQFLGLALSWGILRGWAGVRGVARDLIAAFLALAVGIAVSAVLAHYSATWVRTASVSALLVYALAVAVASLVAMLGLQALLGSTSARDVAAGLAAKVMGRFRRRMSAVKN